MPAKLSQSADDYINDPAVEGLWAIKAVDHMKIHFNLIRSIDPKILKLTPKDEEIYTKFREQFAKLSIDKLSVDDIKSPSAKEEWRSFCNQFEEQVEDFNYATLLRLNCEDNYDEANTIIVPRIQFLAIEIARNREGFNDGIREKYKDLVEDEKKEEKRENESSTDATSS